MIKRIEIPEEYRIQLGILLSILLHLLFVLFMNASEGIIPLKKAFVAPGKEVEKRLVFEIVESNPEFETEQAPDDADLASDRNTIASDNLAGVEPEANRPFSDGISRSAELPGQNSDISGLLRKRPAETDSKFSIEDFRMGSVTENDKNQAEVDNLLLNSSNIAPDNQFKNARDLGGFSLSTYEWNFAPYMLELKRRIGKNVMPPPAFTRLGLISGWYVIRFTITREGDIRTLQVIDYKGSNALKETSINAIKYSFPFKPLPEDFPEKELVVTGYFEFTIRR
ncbi:MAG: hypothetical protein GY863_12215 [bacterium]|nr:hypothetical protein [bacterium]